MAFEIIWKGNGLHRVFTDKTSGDEVLRSNLRIHGDSRFDDIGYVINDFTQVLEFEISHFDINRIVAVDNAAALSNASLNIAIVATLEPLLDWIHVYGEKMQDSPFNCKIFDNVHDAYQWCTDSLS